MRFITYFNQSDAHSDGSYNVLIILTYVEVAAIFINWTSYVLFTHLTINTVQYHWNMRFILTFFGMEYQFQMIFRLAQIYLVFRGSDISTSEYLMTSYLRGVCFIIGGSISPCIIIERMCATYFLNDYEKKKRPIIPIMIMACTVGFGTLSTKSLHGAASNIPYLVLGLVLNIWAVMAVVLKDKRTTLKLAKFLDCITVFNRKFQTNLWLEKLNYRRYVEAMDSIVGRREYSLVERFQIAENIRTCKLLHHVVLSIFFFTLVCIGLLAIENYSFSYTSRNFNSVFLNYFIIIYSMIVPCVMFHHNELWRREIKRIYQKIWRRSHTVEPENSQYSSRGCEVAWSSQRQTEQYFNQLNKIWS